jgi:hypothetical protein
MLTPAKLTDLWHHHPAIDSVWPIESHESAGSVSWRSRGENFDLAVISPKAVVQALSGKP